MYSIQFGICHILSCNTSLEDILFNADANVVYVNFSADHAIKIFPYFKKIKRKEINNFLDIFKDTGVNLQLKDYLGVLHIVLLKILLADTEKQVLVVGNTGFTPDSQLFLQQNFELLMHKFSNKAILIYDENLPRATAKIDFKRGLL